MTDERSTFDLEQLTISPLDEIDAMELHDFLVEQSEDFWGEKDLSEEHDPYWFRQMASGGLVARFRNEIVGYLLGCFPKDGPSYIHLVAAHNDFRHQGIGRRLYEAFIERARRLGEDEVEATTVPENTDAISFHSSLGFEAELISDYGGPGLARVLFHMKL
ncbi:GNAT family N-acetyltransferase [Brevibacterium ihuae]|uniref:GNAT family N-acetyltransferase n=1 Tax=Brevibacterium ihuae TaxID=1631743 RepID=UPI000C766DE9|nr:GNAT family N-acetyltransferase [Brevibacterium ihuae]